MWKQVPRQSGQERLGSCTEAPTTDAEARLPGSLDPGPVGRCLGTHLRYNERVKRETVSRSRVCQTPVLIARLDALRANIKCLTNLSWRSKNSWCAAALRGCATYPVDRTPGVYH